jgi:hypothetical protein
MFTKEKLEKWIGSLDKTLNVMRSDAQLIKNNESEFNKFKNHYDNLKDLKHTIEKIYISITSDGSI